MKEVLIQITGRAFKMTKKEITENKKIGEFVVGVTYVSISKLPKILYQNVNYEDIFADYCGTFIDHNGETVGTKKKFTLKEVAKLVGYKIN